jgi:hypothetical protein
MCCNPICLIYGESVLMDHNNILLQKYPVLLYSCKIVWGIQSFNRHFSEYKYLTLCMKIADASIINP